MALGRLGQRASRPRILRARDPLTYESQQMATREAGVGLFGGAKETSKNEFLQNGRPRITRRRSVRRLFVRDPYNALTGGAFGSGATAATFSKEADQFTNNANPMFDPSRGSDSAREVSVVAARTRASKPGKASRGHDNVIRRTLFNQNAGKTLRRR